MEKNHLEEYRLIREYPGSPELGYIAWFNGIGDSSNDWKGTMFYDSHPKFWEKVVEVKKDYEILSFISIKKVGWLPEKSVLNLSDKEGKYIYNKDGVLASGEIEDLLAHEYFEINSVKRLSDGELFSIGDKINAEYGFKWTNKVINKIELTNGSIRIWADYNDCGDSYLELKYISKGKKVLFISEDGVEIFKGGRFISVNADTEKFSKMAIRYNDCKAEEHTKEDQDKARNNGVLWFSTEEAAEKYIQVNKPRFSLKEVIEVLNLPLYNNHTNSRYIEKFKQIANKN